MSQLPQSLANTSLHRRKALQLAAAGAGLASIGIAAATAHAQSSATPGATVVASSEIPISGEMQAELVAFDSIMTKLLSKWSIPGGQLAIGRDNRLVFDRSYGLASVEDGEAVVPASRFRIASTSKPITGVAILQLIEAGQLTLDTPAFPLLAIESAPNAPRDPRIDSVTIEQLLVHSGGWDSATTKSDPQYLPATSLASHTLNAESPAEASTIVRFMQNQPLNFDPGTQSAYSNFGFNVLGRVIEHISGMGYEQYVDQYVLSPAGITSMAIGGTTLAERLAGEVRYYSPEGLASLASVYLGKGYVPAGYGSYYMRSLDAHGGWISTAADLIRFALAIDGKRGTALLKPETVKVMETTIRPKARSAGAGNVEDAHGLAFNTVASGDGWEWSHAGALEGSNCSWLFRSADGTTISFVFNTLPLDIPTFFGGTIPELREAIAAVTTWPTTDLFV